MVDFTFTSPDGKKYTVSGPEGSTKEQAFGVLQQQLNAPKDAGSAGAAAVGGAIKGIPIVGPSLYKGAEYAAGGIRSLVTGEPFKESLGKVSGRAEETFKQHPTAETIGEVGGGIAGMGAAGLAAPEVMGLSGTLPQMIGRSAVSGAGISAADALARGQDPSIAAVTGGAAGAAGPLAGKALGAAAAPVMAAYRGIKNPEQEAARRTAFAMEQDLRMRRGMGQRPEQGLRPQQFSAGRAAGQPVMAMDIGGEATRALARSAANTSPIARGTLNEAINQRYEDQGHRLTDWLVTNFHFPDAKGQQAALDNVARTVNRTRYDEAFQRGSHDLYLASPKLQQMAGSDAVSAAMGAANKAAKEEGILSSLGMAQQVGKPVQVGTTRDLRYWDQVHKELQDMAIRAGHGTNEARRIGRYDQELKAELDRLVPSYAKARSGAASFFKAENALEAGQKAVTLKMKNDMIREGLSKMSPQERQLFQDGYVDRLVQTIRESGNRRNIANKLIFSDAGRERLRMAVGEQKAKELEAFVHIENVMDFARQAVQGNSKTAQYLAELGLAGGVGAGTELYEGFQNKNWTDPHAMTNAMLMYGAARGRAVIDQRVAEQVARMLTMGDPKQIQRAITIIASNKKLFGSIESADAAIGSILTRGSVPAATRGMMAPKKQEQPEPQYQGPLQ